MQPPKSPRVAGYQCGPDSFQTSKPSTASKPMLKIIDPRFAVALGAAIGLALSGAILSLQSKAGFDNCILKGMSADYCSLTFYGR
jgi:hypothetical protein